MTRKERLSNTWWPDIQLATRLDQCKHDGSKDNRRRLVYYIDPDNEETWKQKPDKDINRYLNELKKGIKLEVDADIKREHDILMLDQHNENDMIDVHCMGDHVRKSDMIKFILPFLRNAGTDIGRMLENGDTMYCNVTNRYAKDWTVYYSGRIECGGMIAEFEDVENGMAVMLG